MLNVACVLEGDYCGRGRDYVERLHDMVRRNLADGHQGRFVCFTNRPDLIHGLQGVEFRPLPLSLTGRGWWAKLYLFSHGAFPVGERVLYLDLDTCITGPIDQLAAYEGGFAALRDVYRLRTNVQSSVMAWRAGAMEHLWQRWIAAGYPNVEGGDQVWIEQNTKPTWLQDEFPGMLRSYKVECRAEIPKGTSVVFFHGHPRPHEALGWPEFIWKVGGGSIAEFVAVGTVPQPEVLANVRSALEIGYEVLEPSEPNTMTAVLCAGGPSLADQLTMIASLRMGGTIILAANQADGFLRKHGIEPHAHVMVDAREAHADWVMPGGMKLYSSMCNPRTLEAGDKLGRLVIWHPVTDGIEDVIESKGLAIGGGHTVGVRMLVLAYAMGFRRLLCFGYDSCYRKDEHHAYPQQLNDADRVLDVVCAGRKFKAAPWMAQQAEDFRVTSQTLVREGCEIQVFGDGLIAAAASLPEPGGTGPWATGNCKVRARTILERLPEGPLRGAELGVFTASLSRELLEARPDLHLTLVDSWGEYRKLPNDYDYHTNMNESQQNQAFRRCLENVGPYADRVTILRKMTSRAAKDVPDGSLDFVFIDADHSYEGCKEDIILWLPKVKPGGLIGGHDYANPEYPEWGVERAVDEIFGARVELGENTTWYVRNVNVTAA